MNMLSAARNTAEILSCKHHECNQAILCVIECKAKICSCAQDHYTPYWNCPKHGYVVVDT